MVTRYLRVGVLLLLAELFLCSIRAEAGPPAKPTPPSKQGSNAASEEESPAVTADPILRRQIGTIQGELGWLNHLMVERKLAIDREPDEKKKLLLYSQWDRLRRERKSLEWLLQDLVEEARAIEWSKIDEAISRVRALERELERTERKEDTLRDRQQ